MVDNLVGGFNPLKNMRSSLGMIFHSQLNGKIIQMFQTTNQLFTYTYKYHLEKYEFVSWDDDIPNIWRKKTHVPNHQPDTSFQQVRIIYIECVPIEHGGVSMAMP